MKLCLWHTEKSCGEPGYDPTQKYQLVWVVMVHNMWALVKKAGLDLTLNETTWENGSYADVQSRILETMCFHRGTTRGMS